MSLQRAHPRYVVELVAPRLLQAAMVTQRTRFDNVIRFAEDGKVVAAGVDNDEAFEVRVPRLPGLSELVVDRALVRIQGRRIDVTPVQVAKSDVAASVRLQGRPGALRRVELRSVRIDPAAVGDDVVLRASTGSVARWRWRTTGDGIERDTDDAGDPVHVMVRPTNAPPAAAVPHYEMPDNAAGLYGPVLAGASLRLDDPVKDAAAVSFEPPVAASDVEVFVGANRDKSRHGGLPHEAVGLAWTAQAVVATWASAPHDVTLTAASGGSSATVAELAGELSDAPAEIDLTPAARAVLHDALAAGGTDDLVLRLTATSTAAGELAGDEIRLDARYRHAALGSTGLSVTLEGAPVPATIDVPPGLVPVVVTMTLDGRFGPARLVAAADDPDPATRHGVLLRAGTRVARRLALAGIERNRALVRAGLLCGADTACELLVQVCADAQGRPGAPLADPVALRLGPGPPAWHRAPLPERDAGGANDVWVIAWASTGVARWYGPPVADRAVDGLDVLISLDEAATWDAGDVRPALQLHVTTDPEPEPIAIFSPHGLLTADVLTLPSSRARRGTRAGGGEAGRRDRPRGRRRARSVGVVPRRGRRAHRSGRAHGVGARRIAPPPPHLPARREPPPARRRGHLRPVAGLLMPGLLVSLDDLFGAVDIEASISVQLGPLDTVAGAVTQLASGPADLSTLIDAIESLPVPAGLDGLVGLGARLSGIPSVDDLDIGALFGAVLDPLGRIGVPGFGIEAAQRLACGIEVARTIVTLTTGELFSGGFGLPVPAELWGRRGMPTGTDLPPEEVRAHMASLRADLDAFGPHLDGAALVRLLKAVAPQVVDLRKWPHIPIVSDVLEIAAVAVTWEGLDADALTAHLDQQLARIGDVIAMPRTRVAGPLIAQANLAAEVPARLRAAATELTPLLARLAAKVTTSTVQPSIGELVVLERHVLALDEAAAALDLDGTPLGRLPHLVDDLELQLLRAVRAFHPAMDVGSISAPLDALLAQIPEPDGDALGGAAQAIVDLDLSFLTDPLAGVQRAVQSVVDEITAALDTVREHVTAALQPIADALDGAIEATGVADVRAALADLPDQLRAFVDSEVRPTVEPIRDAITGAVAGLDSALDEFDPASLIDPLRDAIERLADLLDTDEIRDVVGQVHAALEAARTALADVDVSAAADEVVDLLADLESSFAEIDPLTIPEPAVPIVEGAVEVVASIDFTAELAGPVTAAVGGALDAGPGRLLDALDGQIGELRTRLDQFRPSVAIGDVLDRPFVDLLVTLQSVSPAALLDQVVNELRRVADRVQLLDPSAVLSPIEAAHGQLVAMVETVRPSNVLRPVDEAIAAAIERLFDVTGVDDVFDGLNDAVATVQAWIDVVVETEGVVRRLGELVAQPGSPDAALTELVEAIVGRLGTAHIESLQDRFEALGDAVRSVRHGTITADITRALRAAQVVPAALRGPDLAALARAARAFPRTALADQRPVPKRRRLVAATDRLVAVIDQLEAAAGPFGALSAEIDARAPRLQADLATYSRLTVIDGADVFADCIIPIADRAALLDAVRRAAREGLELPMQALFALFGRIAPHLSGLAIAFADVVKALQAKLGEVTGAAGIGGAVDSLEAAADLLRGLDLSAVTDPLDAVFARIDGAVGALDPAPLRATLQAAADAVADLLDLDTLIDPASVAALDATYDDVVERVRALRPGAVVAATLDPLYEELLGGVVPLLDLPGLLRDLLGSVGADLGAEVTEELGRVEVAFDSMLRAVPIRGGRFEASIEVSASASVGGG